ncbi:MAG: RNA recognition motif domain-containing protein [Prochlorotrichaceae cyanobacterium]|jgi:RNA recognition motif-containing protein
MSIRLYIGNLPKELERQELDAVFSDVEDISLSTKIITDRKTGKCRGFGFVTVQTDDHADQIIEKFNGITLKDSVIKIEKALPRTKGGKGDGEGEEGEAQEPVENTSNSNNGSSNRKKGKTKRSSNSHTSASKGADSGSFQPDPRWASKLEQLKEMLATQTTNV